MTLRIRSITLEDSKIINFNIKTSSVLQGEFTYGDLNLLLVFQVNCPGCFVYALPLANDIHHEYGGRGVKVLGLSTAFEDFEYNNEGNTRQLIEKGALVGETKRILEQNGASELPYSIDFPVAFDYFIENSREFYTLEDARGICLLNPKFTSLNDDVQEEAVSHIMRNLKGLGRSSYTFTCNLMRGTPYWVMFDGKMRVLEQWFAHEDKETVIALLDKHIVKGV